MSLAQEKPIKQTIAGLVWLVIGLVTMALVWDIKKPGFGNNQDPGPQFFPLLIGYLITIGSMRYTMRNGYFYGSLVVILLAWVKRWLFFDGDHFTWLQFYPLWITVVLAVGGALLATTQRFIKTKSDSHQTQSEPEEGTTHFKALIAFAGGFALYIFLIPWIGFSLASVLFGFVLVWLQGSRWYVSMVMNLSLIVGIKVLFGMIFHVQLPEGVIGFPF